MTLQRVEQIDTTITHTRIPVFTFGEGILAHQQRAASREDAFEVAYDPLTVTGLSDDRDAPQIHTGFNRDTIQTQNDWKGTFNGRAIVITSPDWRMVDLFELACGLSGINRYDGACLVDWNVAVHSYLLMLLYTQDCTSKGTIPDPLLMLYLLLHDAHECYTGDVCTPVQFAFEKRLPGFRQMLKALQGEWDIEIYKRFALPQPTAEHRQSIRHYDLLALSIEKHLFNAAQPAPWACDEKYAPLVQNYASMFDSIAELSAEDRYSHAETWLSCLYSIAEGEPQFSRMRDMSLDALSRVTKVQQIASET